MLRSLTSNLFATAIAAAGLAPHAAQAASGCSYASHYGVGDGYHGQVTASGERFNAYDYSVAHRYYPFGTKLRVTNQKSGKSVVVRVNDRGPYVDGRDLDLSYGAFSQIASPSSGVVKICFSRI